MPDHHPHADFEACEARLLAALNRNMELRVVLRDLIAWRDGGETPRGVWARARDLLRKPE